MASGHPTGETGRLRLVPLRPPGRTPAGLSPEAAREGPRFGGAGTPRCRSRTRADACRGPLPRLSLQAGCHGITMISHEDAKHKKIAFREKR